jgi:hypothetical protein
VSDDTPPKPRPNWGLILGLLVGVGVALAIFIPAIMTRPTPKSTTPGTLVTSSGLALPGPLGGPQVAMDVNTLVGRPAPSFTLSDSDGLSFPISPGGGTRTVLLFNMGVT